MLVKYLLVPLLLLLVCTLPTTNARGLRKKPKVYNALITTDENLTSSRAYPVIQPTIHESGIAHTPFGLYNPYTLLNPPLVRFGQPLVPGLPGTGAKLPYPLPTSQFPPQFEPYPPQIISQPQQPPTAPADVSTTPEIAQPQTEEQQSSAQAPASQPPNAIERKEMPKEQLPIPLNEYGLPPMLIRLPQQPTPTFHLPPYRFNQYPLIYEQVKRERMPYLPPYDYLPPHTYGGNQPNSESHITPTQNVESATAPPTPQPTSPPLRVLETAAVMPSFEDIRNGAENKNSDVPDVPPPPIPSGPKRSQ